jgi:hypothetical protein
MKTDVQVWKLEPTVGQRVLARAEHFLKAAAHQVREAQLAHLQRLQIGQSRNGQRGVFLL